jgi:hypothetical protein
VGLPWPPPRPLSVSWREGEEARWLAIRERIPKSDLFRDLRDASLVGTELPMASFHGGWSREERADLVVRVRGKGKPGPAAGEHWVVDYKTGIREKATEAAYADQVLGYMEILAAAWTVPVRGFLWYVETGESVEIGTR